MSAYQFSIGHVSSPAFGGWNSPANFLFTGTPEEAYRTYGDQSEADPFGWSLAVFEQAASEGKAGHCGGCFLEARQA